MRIPWKKIGQASEEGLLRAKAAISEYEGLFSRIALISNPSARQAIYDWLGSDDMPGSPAERHKTVVMDLAEAESGILSAVASDIVESRISQLETAVTELNSKVTSAEAAYGTILAPADTGARIVLGTGISRSGLFAGGIALLALVAVPILAT